MKLPRLARTTLPDDPLRAELDRLAARQLRLRGPLMRGVEAVGQLTEGAASTILGMSPVAFERALESAFQQLYDLSGRADGIRPLRDAPLVANRAAVIASGAAGGWFGLAGVGPDLIASTTVMFNSIQKIARKHGFDSTDPQVRMESLAVFQFGEPGPAGDAAATSFIANRLLTNGQTVSALIARVAAGFAARLTTKLGAQAVPVLGAVTGAAINLAFAGYYEKVADIHFRLLRLAADHPDRDINADYAQALHRAQTRPRLRRQNGTSSAPTG
ncbi:EcsC family protein [Paracoccus sp. (in: a-proteobacteria)]|uniref:EcsC family protein n=1 Tax=Paracoccus sp. TaxID=267 RepID=UPI0026E1131F|nr:EcsC family protein [Paracoccus sp. (in: a-proteobacteria)]MDO5646900.1 EcsC family protein [Paracoccus sp. (in: a-proteobacteria)]